MGEGEGGRPPSARADRRVVRWIMGQLGPVGAYHPGGNEVEKVSDFDPTREAVLLTQGLVQTRGVMAPLERRLREDGFTVFSFHLGGLMGTWNTHPIPEVARRLAGRIRRIRARYQLDRIHMIGHSKGGLIGRYVVQMLGGEAHIKTLITLGSPHRGTPTAYLASFPPLSAALRSVPEMVPGSALIQALEAAPFPQTTRMVSIFSRTDLVCPYWCSWLEPSGGRARNLMVHGPGHTGLLADARVYRLLRAELRGDFKL